MKKLVAVVLLAVGIPAVALADIFVGGQLVPFHYGPNNYAIPFFDIGAYFPLDTWGPTVTFGSDSPLIPDGWYIVSFEGRKGVTKAGWLGIGVSLYLDINHFTITDDSTWAFFFDVGATFAEHLQGWLAFNVPFEADPSKPLFGAWLSAGLNYVFTFEGRATGQ